MEYQRLFDRKLPGNILVSTYHTPMTVRQLAIELGVASVYLEDEIALLEQYGLLTALPGGKYQAHLIIFTEEYMGIHSGYAVSYADYGILPVQNRYTSYGEKDDRPSARKGASVSYGGYDWCVRRQVGSADDSGSRLSTGRLLISVKAAFLMEKEFIIFQNQELLRY